MILWKISSLLWLTRNWRLGSYCLSYPYVILKLQCKETRFIFCWCLMLSSAGRQKCLCWLSFCGVAVLVTISMMCFVETIKSDSSAHWKWAQCMWNMICCYQAVGVSALHQEVSKFSNSIRDSRWMSKTEYEICN